MESMIEMGMAKTTDPSLFMLALGELVEGVWLVVTMVTVLLPTCVHLLGPDGDEIYKMWLNVIAKKATHILEVLSTEQQGTYL